jgi:hypothetical protein
MIEHHEHSDKFGLIVAPLFVNVKNVARIAIQRVDPQAILVIFCAIDPTPFLQVDVCARYITEILGEVVHVTWAAWIRRC